MVMEYEKFLDSFRLYIATLIFKKLPFVKFYFSIKEEYPQLSEKAVEIHSFPTSMGNWIFFIYFNQKPVSS